MIVSILISTGHLDAQSLGAIRRASKWFLREVNTMYHWETMSRLVIHRMAEVHSKADERIRLARYACSVPMSEDECSDPETDYDYPDDEFPCANSYVWKCSIRDS